MSRIVFLDRSTMAPHIPLMREHIAAELSIAQSFRNNAVFFVG